MVALFAVLIAIMDSSMENLSETSKYPKGTVLEVPRLSGAILHVGIASGDGYVVHCAKLGGVVCETEKEFSKGAEIAINTALVGEEVLPEAYDKALSRVDEAKSYNVFNNNCEHLVLWAYGKKLESPQLKKAEGVAVGAAITRINPPAGIGTALGAMVTPKGKKPGGYMLLGGIIGFVVSLLSSHKNGKDNGKDSGQKGLDE